MEHKRKLEYLNKQSLQKLKEYIKTREIVLKEDDHKKLHSAREDWQVAWNNLMQALLCIGTNRNMIIRVYLIHLRYCGVAARIYARQHNNQITYSTPSVPQNLFH